MSGLGTCHFSIYVVVAGMSNDDVTVIVSCWRFPIYVVIVGRPESSVIVLGSSWRFPIYVVIVGRSSRFPMYVVIVGRPGLSVVMVVAFWRLDIAYTDEVETAGAEVMVDPRMLTSRSSSALMGPS